jgi:DNA-binding response OmpR family regulator
MNQSAPFEVAETMKREKEAADTAEDRASEAVEKSILVVDDDSSVREMLSRVLVGEGYHVQAASNGTQALAIAAAGSIDLVLLDLNMPGQNGWDTFEGLTKNNPTMSVIIITARSNQMFTALGAGVGALLEKPLDFPELLETVTRLLAESPAVRLARRTGHTPGTAFTALRRKGAE